MEEEIRLKLVELDKRISNLEENELEVPIQLDGDVKLPVYAHSTDAGIDVLANETIVIEPGESKIIHTGIRMAIPEGYEVQVRPRSGISYKTNIRVANAPGTIDAGYRDEIGVILYNSSIKPKSDKVLDLKNNEVYAEGIDKYPAGTVVINKGDKIAQLVLSKIYHAKFRVVDNVKLIGEDRKGGFGSTGV